jgi:hypothetical protein
MSDHGFNFDKRNLSDLHQRFESLLMFYSYDNWHGDAMLFIFMGSLVRWAKSHIEPPLHAINFGDLALFVSSWKLQSRSVELCVCNYKHCSGKANATLFWDPKYKTNKQNKTTLCCMRSFKVCM